MNHLRLARRIADTEYPISGKSSERLHNDMVRKIAPILVEELNHLELEKETINRKYQACLRFIPEHVIKKYGL